MELAALGPSPPSLRFSPQETSTIVDVRLGTPVAVDQYKISLTRNERAMAIPSYLQHRVQRHIYLWIVYIAECAPDVRIGTKGDVWVNSIPTSRNIFVKGAQDTWELWGWKEGEQVEAESDPEWTPGRKGKGKKKSVLDHIMFLHPWLRQRRLEFTGVCLDWHVADPNWSANLGRLNKQMKATGWPKYKRIDIKRVAKHLSTAPAPRHRIVIPPTAFPTYQPLQGPNISGCSASAARHNGSRRVTRGLLPLSTATDTRNCMNFSPPPSIDPRVKEEEADENMVLQQLKRIRDSGSASPVPANLKRAKHETQDTTLPSAHVSTSSHRPSGIVPPQTLTLPVTSSTATSDVALWQFLMSLPQPIGHHERTLKAIGIESPEYLESFASAPPALLSDLTAALQEHGFTFMEALILRDGLTALRPQATTASQGSHDFAAQPRVEAFLSSLRPSMAAHVPVFQQLGIEAGHLPILAQMDPEPYGEFEQTLRAKGVSWADCFLMKVGLKTRILGS
ncbi:hypothetical protein BD413DRAFT_513348 [Trametes elegans]|nr:hypothetical protein BD413DRAFT_513348 [Trametes elegans]